MKNNKLVPFASLIIIAVLTIVFVKPKLMNALQQRQANILAKSNLKQLIQKTQALEAIDENEIKNKVRLIEDIFPSLRPVLELINSLEILSKEENVPFEGIELKPGKIDEAVKTSGKQSFDISYELSGNLAKISSLINRLETTPPLMKIEKIDLKVDDRKESTLASLLSAGLTVKVFYQAMPETIGSVDSVLPIITDEEVEILKKLANFHIPPKIQPAAQTGKEDLFK